MAKSPETSWLSSLVKQFRQQWMIAFGLQFLSTLALISSYWWFSGCINMILLTDQLPSSHQLTPLFSFASVWVLLRYASQHARSQVKLHVQSHLQTQLNESLADQQLVLTRQHSNYFWQTLWLRHIPAIGNFISTYTPQKTLAAILPVIVIGISFAIHSGVAWTLLACLPLLPIAMIAIGKSTKVRHERFNSALEQLGALFTDRLRALQLLTVFNFHRQQTEQLQAAGAELNKATMSVVTIAFLNSTVLDFFSALAMVGTAIFVAQSLADQASLSLQNGLFLLLLVPLLLSEMRALGQYYHQKSQAEAAAGLLFPVLPNGKNKPSNTDANQVIWRNWCSHDIELQAAQLTISRQGWVNLAGRSGAGKSILLESLIGHRSASHHLPFKAIKLDQHPIILPSTVRHNLCLDRNFSDAQLLEALQRVELQPWLATQPRGLDTEMGEHPPLSGGQAQRLCLARALLINADILLLDEPTAHLPDAQHDTLSQLIHSLYRDKGIIWASHKKLPSEWFDRRWVVADGEVTECA